MRTAPTDRKLRIVFVDHVARLSGGEIAMLRLLPALTEHVDVHVVLGEDGPLVQRLHDAGIATTILPLAPALRDVRKDTVRLGAVRLSALLRLPRYVLRLRRTLRALEADIVQTNSLKAALYGGAAGRLARVPVVWHIRDRIADDYLPRSAVALVRGAAWILPSAVVANSEAMLEALPATRHGWACRAAIVPYSVPTRPVEAPKVTAGTTVGVVGRLAPWKGQHVFLDAFAEAFGGDSVRGTVIGSPLFGEDAYAAALVEQAERLGIAGQIEFRGFREDVWAELAELDVLVHCSVVPEPFGQVVLEGMAAGVPVVAANAAGPAELITNGVDGILTTPGDAHELAAALRELHDDAALRARMGAAGQERSRDFSPERTTERLLAVYQEILPT